MFGDIVKVTPTSKVVGDLAMLMVTSGSRRARCSIPHTQIAFPESVVSLFRGDLGSRTADFRRAAEERSERRAAVDGAAGRVLPPIDLQQARAERHRKPGARSPTRSSRPI
jgi:pyruvate carboxylase